MFEVNISESVHEVIRNKVIKGLSDQDILGYNSYHDVITNLYVQLLNISETLKFNPYSFPELNTGYRYILNYPIILIYKIEEGNVWIVDGITEERWKEVYQSYKTNKE